MMHLVGPILDSLTDAIETLTSPSPVMRLRLGVLPLFAAQRLFPRLAELRDKHPSLHIDVDTAAHGVARLGDGLDAAIVLSREIDPALYARRLDRNTVLAIGARRLLQGPHAIKDPKQLSEMTVLIHREMPDTFDAWRNALKIKNLEPAAIDHFDSGQLMLEAAAQGLGMAASRCVYIGDDARDVHRVLEGGLARIEEAGDGRGEAWLGRARERQMPLPREEARRRIEAHPAGAG